MNAVDMLDCLQREWSERVYDELGKVRDEAERDAREREERAYRAFEQLRSEIVDMLDDIPRGLTTLEDVRGNLERMELEVRLEAILYGAAA